MKARSIFTTVKGISIFFLFACILTTSLKAQDYKTGAPKINDASKANIIKGIESSNLGFKRDCVYFSAIYGIEEALETLKEQLKEEEDPSTCVLISLAIYKLSGPNDIDMLLGESLQDWNSRIVNITGKIVEQYEDIKSDVATVGK